MATLPIGTRLALEAIADDLADRAAAAWAEYTRLSTERAAAELALAAFDTPAVAQDLIDGLAA